MMNRHVARDGLQRYTPDGVAIVSGLAAAYRDDFTGATINGDDWEVIVGDGMALSLANSELAIAAGVVAGAETVITSKFAVTVPCKAEFGVRLSQRIAGQEVRCELVNEAGDMAAYIVFDGTVSTSAKIGNVNGGMGFADVAWPNQLNTVNEQLFEILMYANEVWFASRVADSASGRQSQSCRSRNVPDPAQQYFFRIRVINTGTPANNTNVAFGAVCVQDVNEVFAEITGGNAINAAGIAIPVLVAGGSLFTQNSNNFFADTTTPLAAGAVFTGTSRDSNIYNNRRVFIAAGIADQAGGLAIDWSNDNVTWRKAASIAVAADQPFELSALVVARYWRARLVNGAVAQTAFALNTAFHSN